MNFEQAKNKIGYPCIFSRSPEKAAENLLRLILNRQCGFDEGQDVWRKLLQEGLDGDHDLLELNFCGAAFDASEWRAVFRLVIDGLSLEVDDKTS